MAQIKKMRKMKSKLNYRQQLVKDRRYLPDSLGLIKKSKTLHKCIQWYTNTHDIVPKTLLKIIIIHEVTTNWLENRKTEADLMGS